MLPNGVAIGSLLTDAQTVVNAFGTLLVLVISLGFGMLVARKIPGWVRKATRG